MKILTLEDRTYTLEKIPEWVDEKMRFAVLDNSDPENPDFFYIPLIFLESFNAPAAVCRAAVLYVFRTLVNDDIPMNEGCLKPVEIILPDDCMLRAQFPAAVIAGNVETSQIVTDALYGALGVMAAAQGTMAPQPPSSADSGGKVCFTRGRPKGRHSEVFDIGGRKLLRRTPLRALPLGTAHSLSL